MADLIHARLGLISAPKLPDWAVGRNSANELTLTFTGPNGATQVRVLEREGAIEVTRRPTSLGAYLDILHTTTPLWAPRNVLMLLWSAYVELSIFSLLFLVVSGVFMWLTSRPRVWWAQAAFASGTATFVVLYVLVR
jgi:hypothetical protein